MKIPRLAPIGFTLFVVFAFVLRLASLAQDERRPAQRTTVDPQLGRALLEARANLEAARALGAGSPRTLLRTSELELALRNCPELARDGEEQVRLLLVARLLRDLGRAFTRGEGARRLEEERLTEEDLRFLLGAVAARLARAAGTEPAVGEEAFCGERLRQFRGMNYDAAIKSLFE